MRGPAAAVQRRLELGSPRITEALLLAMAACAFFSVALTQACMGAALVHWLARRMRGGAPPLRLPLAWPMAAFVLVSILSALRAEHFESVRDTLSGALTASVYLTTCDVFRSAASARRALRCLAAAGTAASVVGLVQAFGSDPDLRVAGALGHYYTYAGVVTLAAVASCAWLVLGARGLERAACGLALAVMTAAVMQTHTRSAALALVAGVVVVLAAWKPRSVALVPVLLALGYLLAPAHLKERLRSMADARDETVNERYEMWSNGLAIWRDHPWLGVGPEEVRYHYDAYRDPHSPLAHVNFPGRIHNNAIHLAAERGALGLACWLAFWGAWAVRTARHLRRARAGPAEVRAAVCGALAALAAFHLMGVFECNAADSEVAALSFFLVGLPLGLEALRAEEREGSGSGG